MYVLRILFPFLNQQKNKNAFDPTNFQNKLSNLHQFPRGYFLVNTKKHYVLRSTYNVYVNYFHSNYNKKIKTRSIQLIKKSYLHWFSQVFFLVDIKKHYVVRITYM